MVKAMDSKPPYLNKEEESELAQFVAEVSEIGYGKTRKQIKVWWRKLLVRKVY